jgi:hypothetical protein
MLNDWIEKELGPPPGYMIRTGYGPTGNRVFMSCIDGQHIDCPYSIKNAKCLCTCHPPTT